MCGSSERIYVGCCSVNISRAWIFRIKYNVVFFTVVSCILILPEFFIYQLMHKKIYLKRILKFTLKQLLHVSV